MVKARRRQFLLATGALLAAPHVALAQSRHGPVRLGLLSNFSPESGKRLTHCFVSGLRDLGWVERQNIEIDIRWAEGQASRFPTLAEDLVRSRPDVIVAISTPGAQAARRATNSIPVVFMGVSDPVTSGIVATLAKPGANVTGVSNFLPATSGKLLELLKLAVPAVSMVAVLYNPTNPGKVLELHELEAAAKAMNISLAPLEVRKPADFDGAFTRTLKLHCDGLVTLQEGLTLANKSRIVGFAKKNRLPAVFQIREFVEAGGLMSYGLNYCKHFQSAAGYVDRILKGARPSDLPVELPTTFELLVNLGAAEAIGVRLPQSLLYRADEVLK